MTQLSLSEKESHFRSGVGALRAGDFAAARAAFERITAAGDAPAQVWLLLAHCCRQLGDGPAEDAALDRLLALEPRSIQGLIMKGDSLARAGKYRPSVAFYRSAIDAASASPALPPELVPEVRRAEQALEEADRRYAGHLEALVERQAASGGALDRFAESIDLLLGRKQVYPQQPTGYYFPRLPDIQFYDTADFPWAADVEAATEAIRAEYLAAMAAGGALKPFLATSADHPPQLTGLNDLDEWSAYHLIETGRRVEEHIACCPRTWGAVSGLPLPMLAGKSPSVFFSVLRAGAHIKPHHGVMNTRLVCHLPLVIPEDCGIRVGNEVRDWEEGRLLIFNDAIEHEAWNRSGSNRVVLIFEVWRPELREEERAAVAAMYEAIEAYDRSPEE